MTHTSNSALRYLLCALPLGVFALSLFGQDTQPASTKKPKFGEQQCRADTQKWTYDPFDKAMSEKLIGGMLLEVNGQYRTLPQLSYGVTVAQLQDRIYELIVCSSEDSEFQKKFNTYELIRDKYREEITFRYKYFLMNHHLEEQFAKDDADRFK